MCFSPPVFVCKRQTLLAGIVAQSQRAFFVWEWARYRKPRPAGTIGGNAQEPVAPQANCLRGAETIHPTPRMTTAPKNDRFDQIKGFPSVESIVSLK
jgi:hypothetical protein